MARFSLAASHEEQLQHPTPVMGLGKSQKKRPLILALLQNSWTAKQQKAPSPPKTVSGRELLATATTFGMGNHQHPPVLRNPLIPFSGLQDALNQHSIN